jgi:hypothetical protein
MKHYIATIAAAIGAMVSLGTPATASIVTVTDPAKATEIGARVRWGGTGFEASLFDSNPFGQTPTLNPSGAPVWVLNTPYAFRVTFDSLTGALGLAVDFNGANGFEASESISRTVFSAPGATDYTGLGFRYLSISGNEGGSTARSSLTNLVINGSSQSAITPGGSFVENFYATATAAPVTSWTIAGKITFTEAGTAQERPSWNFNFKDSATPIPVPAALPLMLTVVGGFGLAAWRRRAA